MIKIAFWSKDSGNMLSHTKGLTPEQIIELQKLKEGDRLILWHQEKENDLSPSYMLRKYEPKEKI